MAGSATKDTEDKVNLQAQIKKLSDDVSVLTQMLQDIAETTVGNLNDDVRAKFEDLAQRSGKLRDDASARARAEADSLVKHIAEKPVQSALIALLIGVVFGAMTRR